MSGCTSPAVSSAGGKAEAPGIRSNHADLSVKCSIEGMFSQGKSWKLEVHPGGAASLSIPGYPDSTEHKFAVKPDQLAELDKVMDSEHFFELGPSYGDDVPDSSTRYLSIARGKESKTITLKYLRAEDPKLPEVRRAIRVWNTVRGWFADKDAVDLRPYDQRLLDETGH